MIRMARRRKGAGIEPARKPGDQGIWYPDEVYPIGDGSFAFAGLKIVVLMRGGIYTLPIHFAMDGTRQIPLRLVGDTCYDQEGNQYIQQQGEEWMRINASYPKPVVGPPAGDSKVGSGKRD